MQHLLCGLSEMGCFMHGLQVAGANHYKLSLTPEMDMARSQFEANMNSKAALTLLECISQCTCAGFL